MTDYKALYEQHLMYTNKLNDFCKKKVLDIEKLKEELEKVKSLKQSEINEVVKSDEGTMKLYGDIAKLMSENEELKDELNDWRESAQEHSIGDPSELLVYLNEVKEDKDEYDGIIEYTQALTGSPSSAEEIIHYIKDRIENDDEMLKECEQLRKYNEKLKQFSMEVHNFAFSTKYDDLDIVDSFDLDSIIKELKQDEDNLNHTILILNGFIDDLQKHRITLKNKE